MERSVLWRPAARLVQRADVRARNRACTPVVADAAVGAEEDNAADEELNTSITSA